LGKTIELGVGVNGNTTNSDEPSEIVRLEVIGVLKNSHSAESRATILKKELITSNNDIYVDTSVYVPINVLNSIYNDLDKQRYFVYSFSDTNDYETTLPKVSSLAEINSRHNYRYEVSTKKEFFDTLEVELVYTKSLVNIISVILCLIAGISIMSIVFFSVKERIPEIGIRKAFGASKIDIAFQFVFELVIIAFFVSIFAVCVSFFACKFIETYLTTRLFIPFSISVTNGQLLLPIFAGVILAAICGIVPSLYAASIKVTDALRFE
jgi:putative ABC transport system permease protein